MFSIWTIPRSGQRTSRLRRYLGFAKGLSFGENGVLADDNRRAEKMIKFNTWLANLVIFHNVVDMTGLVRGLVVLGRTIVADQLAALSPYLRAHISRLGGCATDELTHLPGRFDRGLNEVDFRTVDLAS